MWKAASPVDWMVMRISVFVRAKVIRTMTFYGSFSVITYLCQTRVAAMLSICIGRLYLPRFPNETRSSAGFAGFHGPP